MLLARVRHRLVASATLILLATATVVSSTPNSADFLSAKQMAGRFAACYKSARTFQVTFLERYIENSKLLRAETGMAYFRRPGRMRWQYESPEKNLFVVDGKSTWFYVPADHTVIRVPAKQSSDWRTPLALLADEPKLSKVCSQISIATTVQPETSGNTVLFCAVRGTSNGGASGSDAETRAASQSQAVFLELQPQTGTLVRILVRQGGGVEMEFKFGNWQFDPPLPDSLFRFEPPPGVAIVNGELPAGNAAVKPEIPGLSRNVSEKERPAFQSYPVDGLDEVN
jgi:outer membrane lipoprotein carrier protein